MQQFLKLILFFAALMLLMDATSHAWTIGSKGKVVGPYIHTTYFLTPNNRIFPVRAQAYVGKFINGVCQYTTIYNLGTELLKTGDYIEIDAFRLKSVIGGNYNCISIYYTSKQLVIETFVLGYDGFNYIGSVPATNEVSIL